MYVILIAGFTGPVVFSLGAPQSGLSTVGARVRPLEIGDQRASFDV
jgi:hypothetical protein